MYLRNNTDLYTSLDLLQRKTTNDGQPRAILSCWLTVSNLVVIECLNLTTSASILRSQAYKYVLSVFPKGDYSCVAPCYGYRRSTTTPEQPLILVFLVLQISYKAKGPIFSLVLMLSYTVDISRELLLV